MEPHGEKSLNNVIALIPARYSSARFPGKMLANLAGKPLILHTLGQAAKAATVSRVIVATDDERILNIVIDAGGEAMMTSKGHRSGSDRIAEVADTLPQGAVIVNVQGDEPLISPRTIDLAVNVLLYDTEADISTTCERIESDTELLDPNVVKVVVGESGYALYFSRSLVPFPREASLRCDGNPAKAFRADPELLSQYKKHTGLYVYRRDFLLKYTKWEPTVLENIEMLEQLRALEHGAKIRVVEASDRSIGVDTADDLARVSIMMEQNG